MNNFTEILKWLCRSYPEMSKWSERAKEIYLSMLPDYSNLTKTDIDEYFALKGKPDIRPDSRSARDLLAQEIQCYIEQGLSSNVSDSPPRPTDDTDWEHIADYFLLSARVYSKEMERRNNSRKKLKLNVVKPKNLVYQTIYYYFDQNEALFQEKLNSLLNRELKLTITDVLHSPVAVSSFTSISLNKTYSLDEIASFYSAVGVSEDEPLLVRPCFQGLHAIYQNNRLISRSSHDISHLMQIMKPISIENQMGKVVISRQNFDKVTEKYSYFSPMSLVASQSNADISRFREFGEILDFVPNYTFGVLETDLFSLSNTIKRAFLLYDKIPYDLEGLVIRIKDDDFYKRVAYDKNRGEFQYFYNMGPLPNYAISDKAEANPEDE